MARPPTSKNSFFPWGSFWPRGRISTTQPPLPRRPQSTMQIIVTMSQHMMMPPSIAAPPVPPPVQSVAPPYSPYSTAPPPPPLVSSNTVIINVPPPSYGYQQVVRIDIVQVPPLSTGETNRADQAEEVLQDERQQEDQPHETLVGQEEELEQQQRTPVWWPPARSDQQVVLESHVDHRLPDSDVYTADAYTAAEQEEEGSGGGEKGSLSSDSFAKDMLDFITECKGQSSPEQDDSFLLTEGQQQPLLPLLPPEVLVPASYPLEEGEFRSPVPETSVKWTKGAEEEEEDVRSGRKRSASSLRNSVEDAVDNAAKRGRMDTRATTPPAMPLRFDDEADVLVEKDCCAMIAYERSGNSHRFRGHHQRGIIYVSYRSREFGKKIIQLRRRNFSTREWNELKDNTRVSFDLYKDNENSRLYGRNIKCK